MRRGFTLIECMIVVSIAAIICAIIMSPDDPPDHALDQPGVIGHRYYDEYRAHDFHLVIVHPDGTHVDRAVPFSVYKAHDVGSAWGGAPVEAVEPSKHKD